LGDSFTPKVVWAIVKANSKSCGLPSVAPHDLRRTCARLCHQAGGELDQIQFLLGHVSIQTTERYLGCKQRFHDAVNDHIGLEPDAPSCSALREWYTLADFRGSTRSRI
jgi:site-specific recombinase XerD